MVVTGSRTWDDAGSIRERLTHLRAIDGEQIEIMHGGCKRGADQIADAVARTLGYDITVVPANWKRDGKRAGILRNVRMLDYVPDLVLAFLRGNSPGTSHAIAEARRRQLDVLVTRWETR